mmetsp:Transcript_5916/g.8020  ORF Transcript_5916/g.8020 Transcript_5916/m.8020 type:complete len:99 (+) Transcript_5916:464-760(+)
MLKLALDCKLLATGASGYSFNLPLKLFKQESPLLLVISINSNVAAIVENPAGAFMRLLDDKSLILRLHSRLSHRPSFARGCLQIEIETTLLQYHGHSF